MKPKVLKSERDYKAALAYVERLMDQPSPDEDELELWSLLVENYEESHISIAAPDPIEAIASEWIKRDCNSAICSLTSKARARSPKS